MAEVERESAERLDRMIDSLESPQTASGDLQPLLGLAAELRRTLAPAASTEAARHRVLARVLQGVRTQTRASHRRRSTEPRRPMILRPAYAIAGLALAVLLTFSTGVAYASESTLSGDALYPIKRGLEQARLTLSGTVEGDAALTASFADRRLAEIESLTARGRWNDVERTLQAYQTHVDDLVRLEALASDPGEAAFVEARLTHHLEVLERVRGTAPESAQPALLQAIEHTGRGRQEVERRQDDRQRPDHTPPGQEKKSTAGPGNSGG